MPNLNPACKPSLVIGCCTDDAVPPSTLTATITVEGSGSCDCMNGVSFPIEYQGENAFGVHIWNGEYDQTVCGGNTLSAGIGCYSTGEGFMWGGGVTCGGASVNNPQNSGNCDPFVLEFPSSPLEGSSCCDSGQRIGLTITS